MEIYGKSMKILHNNVQIFINFELICQNTFQNLGDTADFKITIQLYWKWKGHTFFYFWWKCCILHDKSIFQISQRDAIIFKLRWPVQVQLANENAVINEQTTLSMLTFSSLISKPLRLLVAIWSSSSSVFTCLKNSQRHT